jgi:hypothetical protein
VLVFAVSVTVGGVVSFAFAVNVVFCVIVTVVLALLAFAGASPLFFVQLEKLYHAAVFAIALISTSFPCLYIHAHITSEIHVHLFNVNV